MRQWYYALNTQQQGPISEDQLVALLNSGELSRDSLVWTSGLEKWIPAIDAQDLPLSRGTPPSLPSARELSAPKTESKTLKTLVSIAGAAIGYFAVQALPFDITIRFAAGALAGFLCGLIPYFIAKKRDNLRIAKLALGICTLSGLLLGLILAIPVCVAFVTIVLVTKNKEINAEQN